MRSFAESDAIGLLAQVISAIQFLHGNGFTHSDVKLSNAVQDTYAHSQ
jgi:serine/threonine protein kinase